MSHEEEVVRNAYAKLSLLCGLTPISDASLEEQAYPNLAADLYKTALETKVRNATPTYTLSAFQVGSVASIANVPWSAFYHPSSSDRGDCTGGHCIPTPVLIRPGRTIQLEHSRHAVGRLEVSPA